MTSLKAALPRHLYTDRLTLELFDYSEPHYDCLLAAMNTGTAHANMGDYGIRTPAQFDALNGATRLSPSVTDGRASDTDVYYLLRLKTTAAAPLMGAVSLAQRGAAVHPDMGWCVLEEFMGKGYAAEAGMKLLSFARDDLRIQKVMTWPGTGNQGSIRVAQKIGFVEGGTVRDKEGGLNVVYVLPGMQFDENTTLSLWGDGKSDS